MIVLLRHVRWRVQRAGCDTPAVRMLLGSGGPTDASLMQFLGVLEQRTHELLEVRVHESFMFFGFPKSLVEWLGQHPGGSVRRSFVHSKHLAIITNGVYKKTAYCNPTKKLVY